MLQECKIDEKLHRADGMKVPLTEQGTDYLWPHDRQLAIYRRSNDTSFM